MTAVKRNFHVPLAFVEDALPYAHREALRVVKAGGMIAPSNQ